MDQNDIPPLLTEVSETEASPTPSSIPRWRWWLHLLVLAMFPLMFGILSLVAGDKASGALLPSNTSGLILASGEGILIFALFFLAAWLLSRVNSGQLLFKWHRGGMPLVWGVLYSAGLRLIASVPVVLWILWNGLGDFKPEEIQEKVNHLADPKVLTHDPVYLGVALTLVSFVLGGFREELWRAGMFAGVKELFPHAFARKRGKAVAVILVAFLFGCGHVSQGPLAAVSIGFVGAGLGFIMLWHRSIWEATIAHGFFDATTFAMVWWLTKYHPHIAQ